MTAGSCPGLRPAPCAAARAGCAAIFLTIILAGAGGAAPDAAADSTDAAELGVGMGFVGALFGGVAGPEGALVGGLVGTALGAKMAGDPKYTEADAPDHPTPVSAERAEWVASRRESTANLRDEQRTAFEKRLQAGQGWDAPPPAGGGSDRALVEQIQRGLAREGYEPGAADGILSPATIAAIESFQRDHRLPRTGEPSMELLEQIRRAGG